MEFENEENTKSEHTSRPNGRDKNPILFFIQLTSSKSCAAPISLESIKLALLRIRPKITQNINFISSSPYWSEDNFQLSFASQFTSISFLRYKSISHDSFYQWIWHLGNKVLFILIQLLTLSNFSFLCSYSAHATRAATLSSCSFPKTKIVQFTVS